LSEEDECYYLREWTKGGGYQASETNQLIANLKKSNDQRGRPGYHYKGIAIGQSAREFRRAISEEFLRQATLVPVPPSAAQGDPAYDDRMTQVLNQLVLGLDGDVRELIIQRETMMPAHLSGDLRPRVVEIYENYEIDETLANPEPRTIALFDDVLVAGAHFKAAQRLLRERFSGVPVIGVFIARRIFPPDE
jgi:predicted amidophosphoribosyltransferase